MKVDLTYTIAKLFFIILFCSLMVKDIKDF